MPIVDITRFDHISLHVRDMDASLRFYRDALGMDVIFEEKIAGANLDAVMKKSGTAGRMVGLRVPGGDAMIELISGVRRVNDDPGTLDSMIFSLRVDDAEKAHAALTAAGIAPQQPVQQFGDTVKLFFVVDPDGRRIEFLEALAGAKH